MAAEHLCWAAFQNSIVTKKSDPSNPVEFHKIRYNSVEFWLEEVLYRKNWKPKNRPNLPINRTELAEIRSHSSKICGIIEVIEVWKNKL
jgi:hypothetical protein